VDYYGTQTPLNQVAKVTLIDGRTIGVQPFEKKNRPGHREGDPRFQPGPQSGVGRRHDPRADALAHRGTAQGTGQGGAQGGRNRQGLGAQRQARLHPRAQGSAEGKGNLENDERRATDDVQKLTDRHIAEIDKLLAQKEAELMAV
jgi:ribosome recycling factor